MSRRGFVQTASVLTGRIRTAAEKRGFAETRLLTEWATICGPEIAAAATPVRVAYGRDEGFGATLVILCSGARAPEVQMQLPTIRARVNACYGYNAIARVRITQTAPTGFHEAQASFTPPTADPAARAKAAEQVSGVRDAQLRDALQKLAENVHARRPARPTRKDTQ